MILAYNGKRKNAWSKLSMAKLYSKRTGAVSEINEENAAAYDSEEDPEPFREEADGSRFHLPFFTVIEENPD